MTKYRLKGMDCAQCAHDIECELRKTVGLEGARISFATESIYLDSAHEHEARAVIARVEPAAQLVALDAAPTKNGEPWRLHLARIIAAALLLVGGITFNHALHATPGSIAEYAVLLVAYALVGYPVIRSAAVSLVRGQVFNEMFLMSIATLGAIAIHQLPEAVGVMLFYAVGEYVQNRAVARSRRSVASLMNLRPESARVILGDVRTEAPPEQVAVGALTEVLPGERIPLDGEVVEGSSFVDTSSLTGESVPRSVGAGDPVLAGFVNDNGRLVVRVGAEFGKSAAARILELVESAASHKAPTEKFISRFAAVYTPIVVALAALLAFVPPLVLPGATLGEYVYRALVLLVISCPCALVISIPLGYFGGIGAASRNRLLVKGSNFIDALAKVDTFVFDKTGTLTEGVFTVTETKARNGFSEQEILRLAAAAESHSLHPIARSIREAAGTSLGSASDVSEIKGHGVIARVGGRTILVGNDRLLHRERIAHEDCNVDGTIAYVAVDGKYAGYLVISDRTKREVAGAIAELRALGVRRVVMLTGDDEAVASRVAAAAGINEHYAELLPEDKVRKLEELQLRAEGARIVAFVGDGMNDAPVLTRSDVGIAMGGLGSDAAIEAADVVVMDDHLGRVPMGIRLARFTRRVVFQNIVLAMVIKALFIALGSSGVANMWEAVIGDVGVSLLAVFNAMRTIRFAGPAAMD